MDRSPNLSFAEIPLSDLVHGKWARGGLCPLTRRRRVSGQSPPRAHVDVMNVDKPFHRDLVPSYNSFQTPVILVRGFEISFQPSHGVASPSEAILLRLERQRQAMARKKCYMLE